MFFNPHNCYSHQEDKEGKVLERLSNLPKKYDLKSGNLTQETTLLTIILFFK